jgi:phenylpyruvate tautomerase PptA (4-oxalocrotonate tautomerase family)
MPLLKLQTSAPMDDALGQELLPALSRTTAEVLGKPEQYVMVIVEDRVPLLMGGSRDPAALAEVRSVGTITADQARAISEQVTALLGDKLGLPPDRIFLNFFGVPAAMWGFSGSTFG